MKELKIADYVNPKESTRLSAAINRLDRKRKYLSESAYLQARARLESDREFARYGWGDTIGG